MASGVGKGLRNIFFQVHLWAALITLIALVPIGLTGSAVAWPEVVDALTNPAPRVASSTVALAPGAYVAAASQSLRKGARLQAIDMPASAGEPVKVTAQGPGRARTVVWLDPADARVLKAGPGASPVFMFMHDFHETAFMQGIGRQIVGYFGVVMLILAFTGLWLWWPRGAFVKGFRWRRTGDTLLNLHYLLGFWMSIPMAVIGATGAVLGVPLLSATFLGTAPDRAPPPRAPSTSMPALRLTAEQAIEAGRAQHPGTTLASLNWPTAGASPPVWRLQLNSAEGRALIGVDDATGAVGEPPPPPPSPMTGARRAVREIHEGEGAGLAWKLLATLSGFVPLALAVTGAIVWAKLQLRKARRGSGLTDAEPS